MRQLWNSGMVAVVGASALVLGACGVPTTAPVVANSSAGSLAALTPSKRFIEATADPDSPYDELVAAATRLFASSFRFTLGNEARWAEGEYDASTGGVRLTRTTDGHPWVADVFGGELLLSGLLPDGAIVRVETARLPGGHDLLPIASPLLVRYLLTGVSKPVRDNGGEYSGQINLEKVDLTGVSPSGLAGTERLLDYLTKQAADRAGDLPFTAVVCDETGALTTFRMRLPKADRGQDMEYEFVVTGLSPEISVVRPGGPVLPAPVTMYQP